MFALQGYTEITIIPNSRELRTIHLHCRQLQVERILVSGHVAEFAHYDPWTNITLSDPKDFHAHPELKRKFYSALSDGDEGELSIAIPAQVSLKPSHGASGPGPRDMATLEPAVQTVSSGDFLPIKLVIEYTLTHPTDGFQFVMPSDPYPYRVPHAYTTPSSPDAARCWIPCVDNLWERCTWEFEIVVPRYLERSDDENEDEQDGTDSDKVPVAVVCSGELVELVDHPSDPGKVIFLYVQSVPTSVHHIALAAGPFHLVQIPADQHDEGSSQASMHAFCLPGQERLLSPSVMFLRSAMNFYTTEFGSYPYSSHKLVFVDELPTQRFDSATLSLVSVDILHGEDAIDMVFETRQQLSHALACQWMGINVYQKVWSDTWLINGIGLYIAGLFMRRLMGNNEYRFRLRKDMDRVMELDRGTMPPICQPGLLEPPDSSVVPFINLKSALVLHILDRRLGKSGTSLGLSRVLPKLFLSAISGEMQSNALSTNVFLKTCRKVSGYDPRAFAEQWIYGSGCPRFGFTANFNRKRMAVEIAMRQECPAFEANKKDPVTLALLKPVEAFEGQMTVRIHEADGTPYEHVLDIRSLYKRYEVPFNTKYKRIRRNTKRFIARQQAAALAAAGDTEAAEAIGMIDVGFGLDVWEDAKERENWKVADWTEEEEQAMAGATYEWIRMDADFEWIATLAFEQPDFMWVSQLQRDRDVVAQLEAVHALARQPSAIVSGTFTKTALVTNYFYRIRVEAALSLVTCATDKLGFIGLFHLFKIFLRYCHPPQNKEQDLFTHKYVPLPNDFSDFSEYFVRKAILTAISQVRFDNGKTPPIVRRFLIDQLRYNDNTNNAYADALYISSIIAALGCASVSTAPPEHVELSQTQARSDQNAEDHELLRQATTEIERYRNMDRLVPSSHNVVTIAILEWYMLLNLANLKPSDPKLYLMYTREGNYTPVRIAGFDGLLLTKWYTPKLMQYVLSVVANDPSRVVRRHVARSIPESLAILFSINEIKNAKDADNFFIEEDGTAQDKGKDPRKSEILTFMKTLRRDKELGRNEVFRESIMQILLAPEIDHEVRWSMLQVCEILVKGAEEVAPKVTIHIPITPVSEAPPAYNFPPATPSTPSIPLTIKPVQRRPTIGGPKAPQYIKPPPPPRVKKQRLAITTDQPATPTIHKIKLVPRTPAVESTPSMPPPEVPVPTRRTDGSPQRPSKPPPPPPSKKDKLPKAQASGMDSADVKACRSALQRLAGNKHSVLFRQPVDPVRDHAPNYHDVIKLPMDLSTMKAKLDSGMYRDRFDLEDDFRLMIENAKQYNQPGQYAFQEAISLDTFFTQAWTRINTTLAAAAAGRPQAATEAAFEPGYFDSIIADGTVHEDEFVQGSSADHDIPPTPNVTASSRVVKLKLPAAETVKASPKLKAPKHVPAPAPPPPLAPAPESHDDVLDDLMSEVIAIEMETGHVTPAPKKDKTRLATPAQQATPIPVPTPVEPDVPLRLKLSLGANSNKAKAGSSKLTSAPSKPSKGKDQERSAPTAASSSKSLGAGIPIQKKKCTELLRMLRKAPEAIFFLRPVNAVLEGCPTYYDEIKHPMDLQTMGEKLERDRYQTMEQFGTDMGLIFSNCHQFNTPTTLPTIHADALEKLFQKEWAKLLETKLGYEERRSLLAILARLKGEDVSLFFREAVDTVKWNVPNYYDIIKPDRARDLTLIRGKLERSEYDSAEAVVADIQLLVDNAVLFNGATSEVAGLARAMQARFRALLDESNSRKRKEPVVAESRPSAPKKVKIT